MPKWFSYKHVRSAPQSAPPMSTSINRIENTDEGKSLEAILPSNWLVSYTMIFGDLQIT